MRGLKHLPAADATCGGRVAGWRRLAAALCVAMVAATGLTGWGLDGAPIARAATTQAAEDGKGGRVAYGDDQFSQAGFDFRVQLGKGYKGTYITESGKYANGFNEFANVAVALVDPRGRSEDELAALMHLGRPEEVPAYDFKLVALDAWRHYLRPEDYQELSDQGVENLLMVRAMSFPGVRENRKKTGLHSERLIKNLLDENRTGKAALRPLSWYTEREPCEECGEEVIEDGAPVFFVEEYGLTEQERAQRDAELKKPKSELQKISEEWNALREQANEAAAKLPPAQQAKKLQELTKEAKKVAAAREAAQAGKRKIEGKYRRIASTRADTARGNLRKSIDKAKETYDPAKGVFVAAPKKCPGPQAQSLGRSNGAAHVQFAAFSVPGHVDCGDAEEQARGGLAQGLATPALAPGGIDFSRLELRYLADPGPDRGGLRYAFKAPLTASGKGSSSTGLTGAKESSNAFFTWLELEPSTFWVNLNPTEPDRIVDSRLGRTDAGRALLEADLQLKKTTGKLIHPDTKVGAEYWEALSGDCMSFRTWIVPKPATVHEQGDELHILQAPLDVQMETQYLTSRGGKAPVSCPKQSTTVQEQNEAVFRRLILPKVVKEVNTGPAYAALRRVYLSRIAAEWYRKLSQRKKTAYGEMIDKGEIGPYETQQAWTPRDTFDRYVDSYSKGEFKVTHRTREGNTVYTRTYIYGGVDFSSIRYTSMPADRMKARWPTLTRDVNQSLAQPVADKSQGQVWLGGGGVPVADVGERAGAPNDGGVSAGDVASGALRWLPAVALLAGLFVLRKRWRRRSR